MELIFLLRLHKVPTDTFVFRRKVSMGQVWRWVGSLKSFRFAARRAEGAPSRGSRQGLEGCSRGGGRTARFAPWAGVIGTSQEAET